MKNINCILNNSRNLVVIRNAGGGEQFDKKEINRQEQDRIVSSRQLFANSQGLDSDSMGLSALRKADRWI